MTVLTMPRLGVERADKQYRMRTLDDSGRRWRSARTGRCPRGRRWTASPSRISRRTAGGRTRGRLDARGDPDHRTRARRLHRGRRRTGLRRRAPGAAWSPAPARTWCGWTATHARRPRSSCPASSSGPPTSEASSDTPSPARRDQPMYGRSARRRRRRDRGPPQAGARRARAGAVRHGLHGAAHGVHHLRHRHPADRRPAVGRLPGDAGRDGVHRQVLRPDVGGVSRWPARPTRTRSRRSGRPIGFLAGWSLLLDYLFLPMLNYLVIGIYMSAAIPAVPAVGVDPGVDRRRDGAQHRRHRVGGAGQLPAARGAGHLHRRVRGDGLRDHHQGWAPSTSWRRSPVTARVGGASPIFAGAAILCLSFLGFDAVSTLSEEAKDPTRTVPKAIMIATVACGAHLLRAVLRLAAGVPVEPVRRRRLGFAGRHDWPRVASS